MGKDDELSTKLVWVSLCFETKAHYFSNLALLDTMKEYFNFEELKTLAFEMDIDHEGIDASNKITYIREFILLVKRIEKDFELYKSLYEKRPHVDWDSTIVKSDYVKYFELMSSEMLNK